MRVSQIFRYAADRDPGPEIVDGYPNFFYHTQSPGHTRVMLERGINSIASVNAPDGERGPAIVLSSSPHKIGSADTPWQDFFEPDEGHVRYFGDSKIAGSDPASAHNRETPGPAASRPGCPSGNTLPWSTPRRCLQSNCTHNLQYQRGPGPVRDGWPPWRQLGTYQFTSQGLGKARYFNETVINKRGSGWLAGSRNLSFTRIY